MTIIAPVTPKPPVTFIPAGLRRSLGVLGAPGLGLTNIVCVGDSITAGQGGDNETGKFNNIPDNTQGWVGQFRTMLANSPYTSNVNAGEGFIFCDDSRITNEGGTQNRWAPVPLGHGFRLIGAVQKFKITVPAGVTRIGVIQANMPKSFNEGGSKLADVTGATKLGAGAETPMTALTNTGIAIETVITCAEGEVLEVLGPATAQTYIIGLNLKTGKTNGVLVHRIGQVGFVAGDMLGGQENGVLLKTAEEQQIAMRSHYRWAGTTGLLLLDFLVNDQQFQLAGGTTKQRGVTKALYAEWMGRMAKQAIEDGWCVLFFGEPRSPSEAKEAGTASADEYLAALKNLSVLNDHMGYLDIGELFGSNAEAVAMGVAEAGTVHPNQKGHGAIARMLYRMVIEGAASNGITTLTAA